MKLHRPTALFYKLLVSGYFWSNAIPEGATGGVL